MGRNQGQSPIQVATTILVIIALVGSWMAYSSAGAASTKGLAGKKDVSELKKDVSKLNDRIATLEKRIKSLKERQSTLLEKAGAKPPAKLTVTDISVPSVKAGKTVTATVTVVNTGGKKGSKDIPLKIDGETVKTKHVIVHAGMSKTISFDIRRKHSGDYTVSALGVSTSWSVEAKPTPNIEVESVDIPTLRVGQTGQISATVVNRGGSKGTKEIELKVGGEVTSRKGVEVSPNETDVLSFKIEAKKAGKRRVLVGSEVGSLKVLPLHIEDDRGKEIKISEVPKRIVSIAPSTTEILFALNAGRKVVGVDKYADYPPKVQKMENSGELKIIGGYTTLSVEKVIGLAPDLVIVESYQPVPRSRIRKIEEAGFPTLCFAGENIPDVLDDIQTIGRAIGKPLVAEDLTENMQNELEKVREKTVVIPENERPKVFWQAWWKPIFTSGSGTFVNGLIEAAGGRNIFSDEEGWIKVGKESIIKRKPEVYIVPPHSGKTPEQVKDTPGFGVLPAVKRDQVYSVPKNIFSRSGPRLVDAARVLAYLFHPDKFEKPSLPYAEVPQPGE